MSLRKVIGLGGALVLSAAVALPGHAAPAPRSSSAEYQGPAGVWFGTGDGTAGAIACVEQRGCLSIPIPDGATSANVEIQDASGQPVLALAGASTADSGHSVCGATSEPLELPLQSATEDDEGERYLYVVVVAGLCEDGTPSLPTTGTVVATFGTAGTP